MKRPAFQFYPADWRKDVELGSCGYMARGIWWEMLCVMHECKPYGHLSRNGAPIPDKSAAELVKVPLSVYLRALGELEMNGVFSKLADGTIFSRRMVRDERIRNVRAAAGKLGGNPILVGNKDKQNGEVSADLLNHTSNLNPTPSSSSSSSSLNQGGETLTVPSAATAKPKTGAHSPANGKTAAWWKSDEGIERKAKELGITATPYDDWQALKRKCFEAIESAAQR